MMTTLDQTVDFSAFKKQFDGNMIMPGDSEYETARVTYAVTDAKPAVIVQPTSTKSVAAAIQFATANSLLLSIRSGKHSGAGFSTNNDGLVLDMSKFNAIEILDEEGGLVRLGTGALWGDVALELGEHNLAISSGDTKSVGVGGLTLGGGIGWMVRKYGFAIDDLTGVEIVLANGSVVRASETENADLFWGLRGGGGNFGVVTTFDFRAHPQGKIVASTITYAADDLSSIITGWRNHMRSATEDLTSFMTLMPAFGPHPASVMIMSCYANDDEVAAAAAIDPLRKLGDSTSDTTVVEPYSEMLQEAHPPQGVHFTAKDMFTKVLQDELITVLSDVCCKPGSPIVQLRMMDGAVNRVDSQATAMAHRDNEAFLFAGFPAPLGATEEQITQSLQNWQKLAIYSSGAYANFISTNTESDVADIYPSDTYKRLAKIKQQYDPNNIFSHNFNIKPAIQ
jgi:FAD/FMN-containing dehydrogenase